MQLQATGQLTSKGNKVATRGRAASRTDLLDPAVAGQIHWIPCGYFGGIIQVQKTSERFVFEMDFESENIPAS